MPATTWRRSCAGSARACTPTPLPDKSVTVLFRGKDGTPGRSQSVNLFGGEATLLLSEPSVDLLVSVQGFRTQALDNVFRDTTVQMSVGPLVRLRLRPGTIALPAGAVVRAYLTPEAVAEKTTPDRVLAMSSRSHWVDLENGEGAVQTTQAGTFRIRVQVGRDNRTVAAYTVEPDRIEVLDTDIEQVFEVALQQPPEGKKK